MKTFHACMIAGTHSGAGKTTVMFALEALARRQGLTVQPFKAGPDYIDPGFHHKASGRRCRNLDLFLLSPAFVERSFARNSEDADLALVEGVMGLFDGKNAEGEGSSAQIAKLLGVPVVLVVDGSGLAGSAAAIVLGFQKLDPEINLAGVIFNRVNHDGHFQYLKRAVESKTGVPCLGFLPRDQAIGIPERHLGLTTVVESADIAEKISQAGALLEKHLDWEKFLEVTVRDPKQMDTPRPPSASTPLPPNNVGRSPQSFGESVRTNPPSFLAEIRPLADKRGMQVPSARGVPRSGGVCCPSRGVAAESFDKLRMVSEVEPQPGCVAKFRIGIARDEAFSFYYEDNLDLLREAGAELYFFSPLENSRLPEDLDLLYFGGGFPEVYAERLARNHAMRDSVKRFYESGGRIYAECGGLIYLAESFCAADGHEHALVGLVPGKIRMTDRLQHFGYHELETVSETFLFPTGKKLRSHEFHYSVWDGEGKVRPLYRIGDRSPLTLFGTTGEVRTPKNIPDRISKSQEHPWVRPEGFASERLVASYQHLHFGSDPEMLHFLKNKITKRKVVI